MTQIRNYTLHFDEEETNRLKTRKSSIYRSQEMIDNSPIIDGLCIQRKELNFDPPEDINITLEW